MRSRRVDPGSHGPRGSHVHRLARAATAAACLVATLLGGCYDYEIVVSRYDPARAYNGLTYFQDVFTGALLGVDMDGEVLWEHTEPSDYTDGDNLGFRVLDNGNILYTGDSRRKILDPWENEVLWEDEQRGGHHDLRMTPQGTILFLTNEWFYVDYDPWKPNNRLLGDVVQELDPQTGEILWEWHLRDHVDPVEHNEREAWGFWEFDWSHCNTVAYYPGYTFDGQTYDAVLLNSRHLDTFWMIDRATDQIIWSCGQHGTFGRREPPEPPLFDSAHAPEMFERHRFVLFDNGNLRDPPVSRALEIVVDPLAGTAEEVWAWTDPEIQMFDPWCGDANRLPNGNTLFTNVTRGRLIEVTPSGEIVWEMTMKYPGEGLVHSLYKCERIPYPNPVD